MRVFICPYDGFSLAIPMDAVLSITLHQKKCEKIVETSPENQNTYISLPLLFNRENKEQRHGIILKDGDDERLEEKIVLLTYKIESETELEQNKIYPLPGSFSAIKFPQLNFSQFFMGIIFSDLHHHEKNELVLILNPEHLANKIKKELKA